jgi:predicted DNA-binding transcriptional regulator YafY
MIALADAIDADALRLRHEFLTMPGLVLTVAQTARLFDVSRAHAQRLLDALETEGFIIGGASGVYRRSPASHGLD